MGRYPKPPEGSWTEHYPELGTAPVSYEDCVSPEIHELEREAIFTPAWLHVGRVEQLPRVGSYFTKAIAVARSSIVVVRDTDGTVRAFHNMCRHRGNKLVWQDDPADDVSGSCRQFSCKYHGWRYGLGGALAFVQQEEEFLDFDKRDFALAPVHCEVWAGFVFVNFAEEPEQSLEDFLGPIVPKPRGLSLREAHVEVLVPVAGRGELEALHRRVPGVLPRTCSAREAVARQLRQGFTGSRVRGSSLRTRRSAPGRHHRRLPCVAAARPHGQADERITRSGLFGPWHGVLTSAIFRRD